MTAPMQMSRANALSYYRTKHQQSIRQTRTYHAQAFSAGPNFTHCTRTDFRALARQSLARAAEARTAYVAALDGAR